MDIVEFLTARYDEDEQGAVATTPVPVAGRWRVARDKNNGADTPLALIQGCEIPELDVLDEGDYVGTPIIAYSAEWQDEAEANLRHIARHDPARVLRDVVAARAILEDCAKAYEIGREFYGDDESRYNPHSQLALRTLKRLAAPYAEHADYNSAWRLT